MVTPTKDCIKAIREWGIKAKTNKKFTLSNIESLLDIIESNNRWPEWSIDYELALDICERDFVVKLYYSTGGWSGHEKIIEELEKTWFWVFCWEQSRRGGHYIFEINPKQFGNK